MDIKKEYGFLIREYHVEIIAWFKNMGCDIESDTMCSINHEGYVNTRFFIRGKSYAFCIACSNGISRHNTKDKLYNEFMSFLNTLDRVRKIDSFINK
jgi:hypothetical protein